MLRQSYPDITLEVAVSNQLFSLAKREADVAIRPSLAPPETLVGRRIGTIAQAIYTRRNELSPNATSTEGTSAHDWIGPDERLAYRALETWMTDQGHDARCHYRVDTLLGMQAAVRDGIGRAALPCYLGDADETLTRVGEPIPKLATDLWLLTHPDLRRVARIRALLDFVANKVNAKGARLLGDT
ncbi:LysR substrate binding domain-containing protein [Modicisalibacter ilicicola DSM 19980]|uniref:LysR substrate binding domain-containing protein n=2 Tax=Modicisalibacter ilicicola TaxID=480814 RepID=A0A1M4ZYR0_9GAMM|nr:LysR substrate binding domain-containing protein [Halomonas ilicicola DSM 19980]